MAIFAPALWALTAVFCILSVVLALPFVDSKHLLRLLYVASGILVVGATSTLFDPPLPLDGVSDLLVKGLAAFAALVGAILCMFSIRQSNGRLTDTLEQTREANEALRESEQSLERKVAERTAELAKSHRELGHALRRRAAGQPGQERLPREHEPRAAHAPERDHRLRRDVAGRGARQRARRVPVGPRAHRRPPAATC